MEVRDTAFTKIHALVDRAREKAIELIPHVDQSNVDYYVIMDEPERTSYKTYTWNPESPLDSIWLVGGGAQPHPIEVDQGSRIIEGLKETPQTCCADRGSGSITGRRPLSSRPVPDMFRV